jgi:hypothetical protein
MERIGASMYPKDLFETAKPPTQYGFCFVLMPFADRFDRVYDAIRSILQGPEIDFLCQRAKLKEFRYIIDEPVQTVREDRYGLGLKGTLDLAEAPWTLVLDEINYDTAHFRLIRKENVAQPRPQADT